MISWVRDDVGILETSEEKVGVSWVHNGNEISSKYRLHPLQRVPGQGESYPSLKDSHTVLRLLMRLGPVSNQLLTDPETWEEEELETGRIFWLSDEIFSV